MKYNRDKQSTSAELKTMVIRMLKEHFEHCNSIKKSQAEIKVALNEIKKKIYREPTVEGMKLRIKSMIWNIRKKTSIQSEKQEEKRQG